ncbi:FAD-dependent oxidoreductase [Pseudonocardia lacus]|uniref:FAD-dependent oxidoreductase n=1 Tax=Pseudonocardia lacus TaxID=2835865 RepID=UPI001BDD3EA9|nr:FAD-dependent oxidoreductase [Pseudonocardia lacus]
MRIAVIGAGVVGLATAAELLVRGHDVGCYESGAPMAARSVGDTRIFRLAHQRPELVEWAARARERWSAWGERAGRPLVGDEGTVVSGDIDAWAAAMSAAGAPFEVTDAPPALPAAAAGGPFLRDPTGGVVRAADTGRFLLDVVGPALIGETVEELRPVGGVVEVASATRTATFDAVVVAAGTGTPALAAQVGVAVPDALVHHTRFTFALRDPGAVPPAWIDRSGSWRPGFGSYGHLVGPGRWAIGAHSDQLDESWESGREAVELRSRELVTAYVAEHVTGALPEVVETVYCASPPGLGDGVRAAVAGAVVVVWGDNLFKFAPVLGPALADAALDREVPAQLRAAAPG